MIFICLTSNPPVGGDHLKIIEAGSPPSWEIGGQLLFGIDSAFDYQISFQGHRSFLSSRNQGKISPLWGDKEGS